MKTASFPHPPSQIRSSKHRRARVVLVSPAHVRAECRGTHVIACGLAYEVASRRRRRRSLASASLEPTTTTISVCIVAAAEHGQGSVRSSRSSSQQHLTPALRARSRFFPQFLAEFSGVCVLRIISFEIRESVDRRRRRRRRRVEFCLE